MQQTLDYAALIAFVVAYFVTRDIFIATAVLLAGVTLQVALLWILRKPINGTVKVTFWVSWALGGLTLVLRNETFIQWKPTIVNWVLAAALVGAPLVTKTPLIKALLGKAMILPDEAWRTLTWGWAAAFLVAGTLNLVVAYGFSMDVWVTFKLFGLMGLNIVFLAVMFFYLYRKGYLKEENLPDPRADTPAADAARPVRAREGDGP